MWNFYWPFKSIWYRYISSHPEVFLRKGVPKIYSKFKWEHPYRSVISIKLPCNFIEIALRHGCSPVNLLHIFRAPFPRNTAKRLLLRLLFNVHYCFYYVCKQTFPYILGVRTSAYSFYAKTKISRDFHICFSVILF